MSETKAVAQRAKGLKEMLDDVNVKANFSEMLGKDARAFQSNILTVYNGSKQLQECEAKSIIAAAAISASVNLSILPSLGQSCIVPYKDGDRTVAQWQIMWKGIVQLAHRTGLYRRINLARVYEGQLISYDEFKGTVVLDASKKKSDKVEGYYFYFELTNGYAHESYWSARKCVEHGYRYSKSFQKGSGRWNDDPRIAKGLKVWDGFLTEGSGTDAMAAKTIVKNELNKWGPLETRVKEAIVKDQAVITPEGKLKYIDSTAEHADTEDASGKVPMPTGKKEALPAPETKTEASGEEGLGDVNEKFADLDVDSVAATELGGEKMVVIRSGSDKYYAIPSLGDVAKKAKEKKVKLATTYQDIEVGGVVVHRLTQASLAS